MKFAVGLVCVAACATKPAPLPANAQRTQAAQPANSNVHRTDSQLTPDVVLATIRTRYIGGVERCYRRHLKRDALARGEAPPASGSMTRGARGRVLVSFTVDPKGRARDGEARGFTEHVDSCIAAQVARWQFPRPAQEARFALGLELGVD